MSEALRSMNRTLDALDTEQDDDMRAQLIDHAVYLADIDDRAAEAWRNYR